MIEIVKIIVIIGILIICNRIFTYFITYRKTLTTPKEININLDGNTKKLPFLVILDIDNTLIDSSFLNSHDKGIPFVLSPFKLPFFAFKRPEVLEFIEYLHNTCYVAIWTHGNKIWADFVIEQVLEQNRNDFEFIWYKETFPFDPIKSWDRFNKEISNIKSNKVLLIDDNLHHNFDNRQIYIPPFDHHNTKDNILSRIQLEFQKYLDNVTLKNINTYDLTKLINEMIYLDKDLIPVIMKSESKVDTAVDTTEDSFIDLNLSVL